MSHLHLVCPWCGEEYTLGVLGTIVIGSGHHCMADMECQTEGCSKASRYHVVGDRGGAFACVDHVDGRTISAVHTKRAR